MNGNTTLERMIATVMADEAVPGDVDVAVDRILSVTSRTRPLPRWLAFLKESPMRTTTRVTAGSPPARVAFYMAALAALLLLAAGTVLIGAELLRRQAPPLPAPFGLARNGSLIFASNGDIYRADPTGGQRVALVTGPTWDTRPIVSPDGTMLAFVRESGLANDNHVLMIASADGTAVRELGPDLGPILAVDWSPDRANVAAVVDLTDDVPTIIVYPTDGSAIRRLSPGSAVPARDFAWLAWRPPDGAQILFRGVQTVANRETGPGLFGMDARGGEATRLTFAAGATADATAYGNPQISSDGSTLLYWTWGANAAGQVDGWSHLLDLNTGRDRLIETFGGGPAAISPDGKWVAGEGRAELWIEAVDGSFEPRQIGPPFPGERIRGLVFSPDGKTIALTVAPEGASEGRTWLVDVATGEAELTEQPVPTGPSWQRLAP